jgi:hypothetical protein
MQKKQDQQTVPAEDERSRGATEPDPNREERTGGEGRKIGKSVQQEDRK